MTILIFFALILTTIVLAILINRIVRCPILVALVFFSVILLIAAIIGSTTLVVLAVILGILAFLAAFFDCIFKSSGFFRNSNCLTCHNPYDDNNNDCCNDNDDNSLAIVNSNGQVVARINGNTVSCRRNNNNGNCGCGNSNSLIAELSENNLINTTSSNGNNSSSSCGCCNRTFRR